MIHVFDREGDITEVFDKVRQLQHTGVLVRAAQNRSLDPDSERLWAKLEAQSICFQQEIDLPETSKRSARRATIVVRFCPVNPYPAHSRRNCCSQSPSNSGFKSQITKTTQATVNTLGSFGDRSNFGDT